jgi:hypothetical protein
MEDHPHTHKSSQSDWVAWLGWIVWGQWRSQELCVGCGKAAPATRPQNW